MLEIQKTFRFEASHILPCHPGKCARLHGHSWVLTVGVSGPVAEKTGMVCDFAALKKVVNEFVIDLVDHRHLGTGDLSLVDKMARVGYHPAIFKGEFYPTSENLITEFRKMLSPAVAALGDAVTLTYLRLEETCTSACEWRKDA